MATEMRCAPIIRGFGECTCNHVLCSASHPPVTESGANTFETPLHQSKQSAIALFTETRVNDYYSPNTPTSKVRVCARLPCNSPRKIDRKQQPHAAATAATAARVLISIAPICWTRGIDENGALACAVV